ncbi:Adenylate cyclase, class 3 [Nitrosomonas sp. Nm51]|uniref:adenylate/guanylate cyclase domain-containing protein n=1 Tax=Nitrosomonas sp. Nm51 TaxID=133720 RepID=UPI0008D60C88|nr:adenylate/guanylate cyclase domain-containing protein [Nitrosomonas sp. Nm51]SER27777.1 Adenylate cyclase, class 3 [Nitrosomonas sp. Nm51]
MAATTETRSSQDIIITSLEKNVWDEMRTYLVNTLDRLELGQLNEPTFFLLHQLVVNMVNVLHYHVFKQIVQTDFGLNDSNNETDLNVLFNSELADHGDKNIAKFCELNEQYIALTFYDAGDTIVLITAPKFCQEAVRLSHKMIQTLGYELQILEPARPEKFYTARLVKHQAHRHPAVQPGLITQQNERSSLEQIFSQLTYGIVCFTGIGGIQAVSPSILALLGLEVNKAAYELFARSISIHFYNDVIWGMALEPPNGKFENYRVRVKTNKYTEESTLFNVSGFRDGSAFIHTLWQKISLDGGNTSRLSEGDLLNEAKVHNITRNYVPQLVEKKAREVVRLGGNLLKNEECYIAVLFCDIVGFTRYVEQNENEESIIHILNSVLRRISLSVKKHGGFIDKFMGDCIMVLFRNPLDAVIAALEMQKHSHDINLLRERAELGKLQLRIGIHWGKVVIGNVGTPERLDWTTIGDVVNTASRIEKNCQPNGVLISGKMREAIEFTEEMRFKCGDTFYINAQGKKDKLAVCYAYSSD